MARLRLVLTAAVAVAAAGVTGVPAAQAAGPTACPAAFPTGKAVNGVRGTGYTVERGTAPQPFTASVLGRITDGIAPRVDMIMAELHSPALQRAGGVWAGMSGSPVYSADGRLIGAVAYRLSAGPSSIAGLTPGEAMKQLLNAPTAAPRPAAPSGAAHVAVSRAAADRLAATGETTAAAAAGGFERLPLPLSVSGGSPHAKTFLDRLAAKAPGTRVLTSGGGSAGGTAPPSSITAGGNFADALSYGDVTAAAVGTTTFVCGGTAVAFGHPFTYNGAVSMTAHPATAVYVQPDPLGGPFKVANLGGVAGTVNDDRLVGVGAKLGAAPPTTLITSTLTRVGAGSRTGTSRVSYAPATPDVAALHTLDNIEWVLGSAGKGSAAITFTVTGRRANGTAFTFTRSDRYASTDSIGSTVADQIYSTVSALVKQPFEQIRIMTVSIAGTVDPAVKNYAVSGVTVKQGGSFVTPAPGRPLVAQANSPLPTRVTLTPYLGIGPTKTIDLAVTPAGTSGSLRVLGGSWPVDAGKPPTSFDQLLTTLRNAPSNASVHLVLAIYGPTGTVSVNDAVAVDRAVTPSETDFPVEVR